MAWFRVMLKDGREFEVEAEGWGNINIGVGRIEQAIEFRKSAQAGPGNQQAAAIVRLDELAAVREIDEPAKSLPIG